jgi:hypothetical protein
VEILSTEVIEEYTFFGGLFMALAVLSGVFGAMAMLYGIIDDTTEVVWFGLAAIAISITVGMLAESDEMDTEYKQYKVVVTDFNESFLDSYEIIEQDGKILTIKEKEDE